jgi:hypothetical protein
LVAFLDSDDAYLPRKLETVLGIFRARPEVDLLVDSFIKMKPGSSPADGILRKNKAIYSQTEFLRALFIRRLWKATPAITVRRETIMRTGLFDESLRRLQDFDFLIRAAAVGRCAATDEVLWLKHDSPDAITVDDTWIPSNVELCRRHPEYLSNGDFRPGLAYAIRRAIYRRLISGRLAAAWHDLSLVKAAFGWQTTAALLVEGCRPRPRLK